MDKNYADIIVDISHGDLDKIFQYKIPSHLKEIVEEGSLVEIPFGNGNRVIQGYVIKVTDSSNFEESKIKEILRVVDNSIAIEGTLIKLAIWMKEQYGGTTIHALKSVIPIKRTIKQKVNKHIKLNIMQDEAIDKLEQYRKSRASAKIRLLQALMENSMMSWEHAVYHLKISRTTITTMELEGVIQVIIEEKLRNLIDIDKKQEYDIILNDEQQIVAHNIIQSIYNKLAKGNMKDHIQHHYDNTHLIYGITGSGKTEVYIEIIDKVIKKGKEVIVLIPEIALTYQTMNRFYRKFGHSISIIHSKLSIGEKHDQFLKAKRGDIKIIIGPRSALFTPFQNLGLIVIDEEHESSYKSEVTPKYNAVEVAIKRGEMENATVILGSATPSLESYTKALNGEYKLHKLTKRNQGSHLSKIHIVDLRKELKEGNRSIFSRELKHLIEDRLAKKEQIMLFINRRGYAGFISCRSCGYVMKCDHCDVSYTLHNHNRLVCHYCGREANKPTSCPKCTSSYIAQFGLGTQQVEELVVQDFPKALTLRMDMDTTSKKQSHEKILSSFGRGEADVLIGTQMIVKGHDFPKVTLVGIIAADLSLYTNDYRASERTFQLLVQASGRAGRANLLGDVVIQTYNPEHYCIQHSQKQDYEEFYKEEMTFRNMLQYPPVTNLLVVFLTSSSSNELIEGGEEIMKACMKKFIYYEELKYVGPTEATISWINDIYRRVIYFKHSDYEILKYIKDFIEKFIENSQNFKNIVVQFDFNPMSMY